ncbi:MAG TPA: epoxyalkane--coenzyme M transferase, partial [Chloroflexota bacterium]
MIRSTDRILTTHVGSLPRPDELVRLNAARLAGQTAHLDEALHRAVADVTRRERENGLDVINDGEFGKATRQAIDYGPWMSYAYQ